MDKKDILAIADGLVDIEEGIRKIQDVMRGQNIKSLKEVAAELIPVLGEDDSLKDSILKQLK